MLSKFAQVSDDGKYKQPPHAKLSYGGMLYIRAKYVATLSVVVMLIPVQHGDGWRLVDGQR